MQTFPKMCHCLLCHHCYRIQRDLVPTKRTFTHDLLAIKWTNKHFTLLMFSIKSEEGQKAESVASRKNWTHQANEHMESQNLVTQGNKWGLRQTPVQPKLAMTSLRIWQISSFPLLTSTTGVIMVNSLSWSFSVVRHYLSFIPSPWTTIGVSWLRKWRLQHLRKSPATAISPFLCVTKLALRHGALGQDLSSLPLSSSCPSPWKALFLANSSAKSASTPSREGVLLSSTW